MLDVMVDIETTGTDPSHAAIIQIAAVRFDLETKQIDTESMFDRCLWIAPMRSWDESTRDFWSKQKPEILAGIYDRMEDPGTVMRAFHAWVLEKPQLAPLRFWSKPSHFDFVFIASYFKQYDLMNPFDFRQANDLNSWLRGRGHTDVKAFWNEVPECGDKHNALNDCIYQISGAFKG
jgi:hypothetical protein